MDIFITWSGPRSLAAAEIIKEYLPLIVNAFNPWLSKKDIDKGANWVIELTRALNNARAGIVCLTPNNRNAPWLLFEAGALAKSVDAKPVACTLLLGLETSDLSGPLPLFQATKPTKEEMLHMVRTLNKAAGDEGVSEGQLEKAFNHFWPELGEKLAKLPPDGTGERPKTDPNKLLEEILNTVRTTSQNTAGLPQIADAITDITARLTPAFNPVVSGYGAGGYGIGGYGNATSVVPTGRPLELSPEQLAAVAKAFSRQQKEDAERIKTLAQAVQKAKEGRK